MENKTKQVSKEKKNYIALSIIVIVTIILLFYSRSWYHTYKEHQMSTAVIDGYLTEIIYEELSTYINDNKDVVIYVTKSDVDEIRTFELKFKSTVEEYNLKDIIVYLNLYDREDYTKDLETLFKIDETRDVPVVVMYKDGVIYDSVTWSPLEKINEEKILNLLEENQLIEK